MLCHYNVHVIPVWDIHIQHVYSRRKQLIHLSSTKTLTRKDAAFIICLSLGKNWIISIHPLIKTTKLWDQNLARAILCTDTCLVQLPTFLEGQEWMMSCLERSYESCRTRVSSWALFSRIPPLLWKGYKYSYIQTFIKGIKVISCIYRSAFDCLQQSSKDIQTFVSVHIIICYYYAYKFNHMAS